MFKQIITTTIIFSVAVVVFVIFANNTQAATCTWTNGGADNDWNNAANWSGCGGNIPGVGGGVGDDVIFDGGTSTANVQLSSSDFNVGSLTMESDYTGTLDFNARKINGTGDFTKANGSIQINQSGDQLDFDGDFIVSGDAGSSQITLGNIIVGGNVTVSGTNTFQMDSGSYTVFTLDGTGNVTVAMGGTGNYFHNESNRGELDIIKTSSTDTVTFTTDVTAWNVQLYEGELILSDGVTFNVEGLFIGQDGAGLRMGNSTLAAGFNDRGTVGSYALFHIQSGFNATSTMITGGTITLDGQGGDTGGQTDVAAFFESGCNWTPSGGTLQLIGDNNTDILVDEATNFNFYNLTIGDGVNSKTVDINATSEGTTDINGDLTIGTNGTLDANAEPMEVGDEWTNNGNFNHGNNTVTFDGTGTQIIDSDGATTHAFYDVVLSGSGTVQVDGAMSGANPELKINDDILISSGTLDFNSRFIQVDDDFNKTSGNLYMDTANSAIEVGGDFTISGDSGAGDLTDGYTTISGSVNISGDNTFIYGGAGHPVMTLDGTGDYTISITGANNTLGTVDSMAELDINLGTAGSTMTATSDLPLRDLQVYRGVFIGSGYNTTISRVLVLHNNSTFTLASGSLTLGSDDLAPTLVAIWHQNSGSNANISGGTVTIEGPGHDDYGTMWIDDGADFSLTGGSMQFIGDDTAEIVIEETDNADFSFYNLTIGDGTNTKALSVSATSTINFDINNDFAISANATFDANGEPITLAGDWTNNGTFTHNNNTVTLDHADTAAPNNTQTLRGDTTFYNLIKDCNTFSNAQELLFWISTTMTIEGATTLKGDSDDLLTLNSSDDATRFNIYIPGTNRTLSYLDVQNSNQTNTDIPVELATSESTLTNTNNGWALVTSGGGSSSDGAGDDEDEDDADNSDDEEQDEGDEDEDDAGDSLDEETLSGGDLAKQINDPTVYLIDDGYKRPIADEYTFNFYEYQWSDVIDVDDLSVYPTGAELKAYPPGEVNIPSEGALSERLKGMILLQVEENGEAWYIRPDTGKRMYMRDGSVAYDMMRDLGLGISNEDIKKIPVGFEDRFECSDFDQDGLCDKLEDGLGTDLADSDSDDDGYNDGTEVRNNYSPLGPERMTYDSALTDRLNGQILLQVEAHGEAWYIYPGNEKRYYMPDGPAAYQIMRYLSLGISNADLEKIAIQD
jgi:hypothetical protein